MPQKKQRAVTVRITQKSTPTSNLDDIFAWLLECEQATQNRDVARPVYHISVVAEMVEIHPQTLRMYERAGLLSPSRTSNNIRLYSDADVTRVRHIQHLTQDLGINLAGVEFIFSLLEEMEEMRQQLER